MLRPLSVTEEQRYLAVVARIEDGRTLKEVVAHWRVSRQTMPAWLAKHDAGGLQRLAHRPHQAPDIVDTHPVRDPQRDEGPTRLSAPGSAIGRQLSVTYSPRSVTTSRISQEDRRSR
jgi:transposase